MYRIEGGLAYYRDILFTRDRPSFIESEYGKGYPSHPNGYRVRVMLDLHPIYYYIYIPFGTWELGEEG